MKCATKGCGAESTIRIAIPNTGDKEYCTRCHGRLIEIARIAGMSLHVEPIAESIANEPVPAEVMSDGVAEGSAEVETPAERPAAKRRGIFGGVRGE